MITLKDGQLFVEGEFNQQTAPVLLEKGETIVASADTVLNLSGATVVDSSAIAAVLGWLRVARAAGRSLSIVHAPAAFRSLSDLYDVSKFLFPESGSDHSAQA